MLASELRGREITVNAVAPGLEQPGAEAGVANLIAFLVGEEGHWVNGQVIRADIGIVFTVSESKSLRRQPLESRPLPLMLPFGW